MILSLAPPFQIAGLLVAHWVGDFILQTSWMAQNKGVRADALLAHVAVYTAVLAVASVLIFGTRAPESLAAFVAINGVLHLATDFVTSRASAKSFRDQNWRVFFVIVGLDQLLHQLALIVTMYGCLRVQP